ncbi:hypothetical protein [Shimazuella kribbensis]|uniref:hypothetical protein n=1 Tax=Shimazuella kribbensis TaxID=139808 RepID=UPI00048DC856|nr:hypothetical protein [Shimazuella kribbensis]
MSQISDTEIEDYETGLMKEIETSLTEAMEAVRSRPKSAKRLYILKRAKHGFESLERAKEYTWYAREQLQHFEEAETVRSEVQALLTELLCTEDGQEQ